MPPLAAVDLKRKEPSIKEDLGGNSGSGHEDGILDAFVPSNSKRQKMYASDKDVPEDVIVRDVEESDVDSEGDDSSRPCSPNTNINPPGNEHESDGVAFSPDPEAAENVECYSLPELATSSAVNTNFQRSSTALSYTPAPTTGRNTGMVDDSWNVRLEELKAYKEQHGDCLVPKKSRSNPQLGIWVMNQRGELARIVFT